MAQQQEQQIEVELSAEVADGIYSNLAIITHNNTEFILDFVNMMPGKPKANIKSRIILTPQHAKRLMNALRDNIEKYESHFGTIREGGQKETITFAMPAAQA
ncbi:MAG: DUF3467 domain-containing protein [Bacteroidales bacterium]|jgi:hypothetical protein|nr:DUF3467 domain-containing protein [Bacteroidales bacterium]